MPPSHSSLLNDTESHCNSWMGNNQGNPFGLTKRRFRTENTLSFPRANPYEKTSETVLQPSQLR